MFLGVETTFRHTFPSSDFQCLPPDDPRVLYANTGIHYWQLIHFSKYLLPYNLCPLKVCEGSLFVAKHSPSFT